MYRLWRKKPRRRPTLEVAGPTPQITFNLVAPNSLDITVQIPETGDLSHFTHMLTWLNQGRLMPNIQMALENVGTDRANLMLHALDMVQNDDDEEPIVCPTKAIRFNIRKNQN